MRGEIEAWVEGRVLLIKYSGSIKEKTVVRSYQPLKLLVAELSAQGDWFVCHDLRYYDGHVPEAGRHIQEFRQWRRHSGCNAEAFVFGDSLFRRSMAQMLLDKMEVTIEHQFFSSSKCALSWLNKRSISSVGQHFAAHKACG